MKASAAAFLLTVPAAVILAVVSENAWRALGVPFVIAAGPQLALVGTLNNLMLRYVAESLRRLYLPAPPEGVRWGR